jgi:spore coat polysaccharide biosynthesis protein SpsF (cytidylyltransferase family)
MPSSGVILPFNEDWLELRATDQFKLTVGSQEDLEVASKMLTRLAFTNAHIIVSPVITLVPTGIEDDSEIDQEWLQTVAQFCIQTGTRYSLQLQKVIWGNKRGV